MSLLHFFHNYLSVPPFLVNSLPKAGTHLVMKAVGLFPGIRITKGLICNRLADQYDLSDDKRLSAILIGVDQPRPVARSALRHALQRIKRGHYALAHTCFSEELGNLLTELGMKTLLILRDPRDVVISHANFVSSTPHHFLFNYYQPLSDFERIMTSIKGIKAASAEGLMLLNIKERYESLLPWLSQPINYTTYFEKLVGPSGGGSRDVQLEELENIVYHLGIHFSPSDIEKVAVRIFGGTYTFRKGALGNWRSRLSDEHKHALLEMVGSLLIDLGYEQDFSW